MKRIFTKRFKRKNLKHLISGGFGKSGPYVYAGVKKGKNTIGASIGTKGKQAYASTYHKKTQFGVKYNINTQSLTPKIKRYNKLKW